MENQNESQDSGQVDGVVTGNPLYDQVVEVQPLTPQPREEIEAIAVPMPPIAPQVEVRYAGFWIRFRAFFIDILIIAIIVSMVTWIVSMMAIGGMQKNIITGVKYMLGWSYFVFMTNGYGATLGKKVFGIKVVSDRSDSLKLGRVILREPIGKNIPLVLVLVGLFGGTMITAGSILGVLSILAPAGYFMLLVPVFSKKKQALHDMIAGTVVVYNKPSKTLT